MSTITLRSVKGTPLTNNEVDANFSALNSDKMEKSSNLSDVASVSTARTNLGVYSTTEVDTAVGLKLAKASNLSDLADVATARTNLDVYNKADTDSMAIAMAIALG
jgi:hypothetical protein